MYNCCNRNINCCRQTRCGCPYSNSKFIEFFKGFGGPRESCEDIICSDCNKLLRHGYDYLYKKCKQRCFNIREQDIMSCCTDSCRGLGIGRQYCLEACATDLNKK